MKTYQNFHRTDNYFLEIKPREVEVLDVSIHFGDWMILCVSGRGTDPKLFVPPPLFENLFQEWGNHKRLVLGKSRGFCKVGAEFWPGFVKLL